MSQLLLFTAFAAMFQVGCE